MQVLELPGTVERTWQPRLSQSRLAHCPGIGQSEESRRLEDLLEKLADHYSLPFTRFRNDPVQRFYNLLSVWKTEVKYLSDTDAICTHPAYQQIIGMGCQALPFIFLELREEVGHWFWALKAITGEDPVPDEERGRMKLMQERWLHWGRQRGYA